MASSDAQESSDLWWIEMHSAKVHVNTNAKVGKIRISVEDSDEKKERKLDVSRDVRDSHTWTLKDSEKCVAFSKDVIRVTIFQAHSRSPLPNETVDTFKFNAKDVFKEVGYALDSNQRYEKRGNESTLVLKVVLRGLGSVRIPHPSSFETSNLAETLGGAPFSEKSMLSLQEMLSSFADNIDIDVLDAFVNKLETFTKAHPFMDIVFKAIMIPYHMWKDQVEFKENLKKLAADMCTSLKSMAVANPLMDQKSSKEITSKLLKLIVEASRYVEGFANTDKITRSYPADAVDRIRRFVKTQFPKKLDDYRTKLRDRRLDFREATLVQVLVSAGTLKDRGDDMTFLWRKLDPLRQRPVNGCLEGTRTQLLAAVETWHTSDDAENVLWISGAPGAGKTTFASTIISKLLHHKCAKFFIKRGSTDPRAIWRTIAYGLSELDRGVKLDVLEVLSGDDGYAFPEGATIEDQFNRLIRAPLQKHFPSDSVSLRRIVVVVDALDECNTDNQDQWHAFLATIVKWREELPRGCKLVVTSRAEMDIKTRLDGASFPLTLDTGVLVSNESEKDIQTFFEVKFKAKFGDSWPGKEAITTLTQYAAGLFIWAAIVVNFMTQKGDHELRLGKVLKNMANVKVADKDPIGNLYAQILFAAAADLEPEERNAVSMVLASLVLLEHDLSKRVLLVLLAPVGLNTRSIISINAAIDSLSSIIVSERGIEVLRVCHKSLSDFLLDEPRVQASISSLLNATPASNIERSSILDTFSLSRQHALLAEGCLWLMDRTLDACSGGAPLQADTPAAFMYACTHWASHRQGAGVDTEARKHVSLAPAIETFPDLQKHTLHWIEVLSDTESESGARPIDQKDGHLLLGLRKAIGPVAQADEVEVLKALTAFATEHPIINVNFIALSIAYKLQKGEHVYAKALAMDMCHSLEFMMGSYSNQEHEYAEQCTMELLKVIIKASSYVVDFARNTDVSVTRVTQFYADVNEYRIQLSDCRTGFEEAVLVRQLAIDGVMENQEDVTSFLKRRLRPATQLSLDNGCLDGTRKTILLRVDDWLNRIDVPNVLWIFGGPGMGKTALASTIVRRLSEDGLDSYKLHGCAKFFIKQRDVALREPCTVWLSVAFELARLDRGVKLDLVKFLSKRNTLNDADSIRTQFQQFICSTLKRRFSAEFMSFRRIVIVIDALDELFTDNQEEWHDFVGTIVEWSEALPRECKLVVTSRPEPEISIEFAGIDQQLALDTGDIISKESSGDIKHFFKTELDAMNVNEIGWPDQVSIEKLTEHAAGSFVWAATAIEIIRGNPVVQVKEILADMVDNEDKASEDKLGQLYGRILFQTISQLSSPTMKLDHLSLVLASVVPGLLRQRLPSQALIELLESNRSFSNIDIIVDDLKPVITIEGDKRFLCARHRSFSDFLQDRHRVQRSMANRLDRISKFSRLGRKSILAIFSNARQHALIVECCLRSMNNIFADDFVQPTDIPIAVSYACCHWVSHLHDAANGVDEYSDAKDILDVRLASLIENFAKEHILYWMDVSSQRVSIVVAFNDLRTEINGLPQSFWSNYAQPEVKNILTSVANNVDIQTLDAVEQLFRRKSKLLEYRSFVVSTLMKPYELLTGQHGSIIIDIRTLVADMCTSLQLMVNASLKMRKDDVERVTTELLEVIASAWTYVNGLMENGCNFGAQLSPEALCELDTLRGSLEDCRFEFREAVLVKRLVIETMEDVMLFLHAALDPALQYESSNEGSWNETSEHTLSDIRSWLENSDAPNVLWISGRPCAGELPEIVNMTQNDESYCTAKFFMDKNLKSPDVVWRTVAFQLAEAHRGIRVNILDGLSNLKPDGEFAAMRRNPTVKFKSIKDQFRVLIREPLAMQISSDSSLPRRMLVIIDAGNNLHPRRQGEWHDFLDTIVNWSEELPRACKLVILTRPEPTIEDEPGLKLKDIGQLLALDTEYIQISREEVETPEVTQVSATRYPKRREEIETPEVIQVSTTQYPKRSRSVLAKIAHKVQSVVQRRKLFKSSS